MKLTKIIINVKSLVEKIILNIIIFSIIFIQKLYLISTDTIDYLKEKLYDDY
jgi:hypothetical protein